ncbi:MAG: hypothetical protein EOO75_21630, partial [Myxococcales bacterium]
MSLRDGRRVVIHADWDPAQTYQVTVRDLREREGAALARLAPLAVRSAGRPPTVRFDAGRWVLEPDAPAALRIDAIHADQGEVRSVEVAPGRELAAALSPASLLPGDQPAQWARTGLAALVPDARANRWGRGSFAWQKEATGPAMAVVQVLADARQADRSPATVLLQRTDLGLSARALSPR